MGLRRGIVAALVVAAVPALYLAGVAAQAPARGAAPPAPGIAKPAARGAAPAARATQVVHGNLAQLMRGIIFPASNVAFAAQEDPAAVKPADDPAVSPNPLSSTYGGWLAVENAGWALAESANLLTIPGRRCMNGKPVPIQNPDWAKFVQELRDGGMLVVKAAQAKNQDQIIDAAGEMTLACSNCHDKYREKTTAQGGAAARCT